MQNKIGPIVRALYYFCIDDNPIFPLTDNEAWEIIYASMPKDDKSAPFDIRKATIDTIMEMLLCEK